MGDKSKEFRRLDCKTDKFKALTLCDGETNGNSQKKSPRLVPKRLLQPDCVENACFAEKSMTNTSTTRAALSVRHKHTASEQENEKRDQHLEIYAFEREANAEAEGVNNVDGGLKTNAEPEV